MEKFSIPPIDESANVEDTTDPKKVEIEQRYKEAYSAKDILPVSSEFNAVTLKFNRNEFKYDSKGAVRKLRELPGGIVALLSNEEFAEEMDQLGEKFSEE